MAETHLAVVHYSGRVQGVGFRSAALQVAREFEVAGYVRNLPDGRVELEAEGRPDEVSAFLAALAERMRGYIRQQDQTTRVRPAQHAGFAIR
jgi:acylphosphatase